MVNANLISCIFDDIYSNARGGVLDTESVNAILRGCHFSSIRYTVQAACFYIGGTSIVSITNVCCLKCCVYLAGNNNDRFGN